MPVSTTLSDLSELALVACDTSYFTNTTPVAPGSPLGPLDEGDPTIFPRFDIPPGYSETSEFIDPPDVSTGFTSKAMYGGLLLYSGSLIKNTPGMLVAFLSHPLPSFKN